jgi:hypothetical protein
MIADLRTLYLETVKRSVAGLTHEDAYELRPSAFDAGVVRRVNEALGAGVRIAGRVTTQQLALVRRIDDGRRGEGGPWPLVGETMIGARRLDHLQRCVEIVLADAIPGDMIEEHRWSLIRVDGDLAESTHDSLENLYPSLSPGGFVIVDDYGVVRACRQAVEEFRATHGVREPIEYIDESAVFWRRRSVAG